MTLIVLLGGARSGKSSAALRLAEEAGAPVAFVATGEARDGEMAERIERHRRERPAGWRTVEEPLELEAALAALDPAETAIVDCLSLWVSNLLESRPVAEIEELAAVAARAAAARSALTVAVSNEVGLGIVPDNPLARAYRDLLGRVNATWAEAADEAYLVVAGRRLLLT